MYAEQDRVWTRHFVGYGAIFLQAEPRLENAITATQSQADGGARPDSSTENYIKGLIYGTNAVVGSLPTPGPTPQNTQFTQPAMLGLLQLEQQIQSMWGFTFAAGKQDDATVDTFRGRVQLCRDGRRMAFSLAKMLGMKGVRADVFSAGAPVIDDDPFSYSDLQHWMRP